MSADRALGDFVLQKYSQLNSLLDDLIVAIQMEPCAERTEVLSRVKLQTNHTGLHYTAEELRLVFFGDAGPDADA